MATKLKSNQEIEEVISMAIKKMHVKKENDLCKYLPSKAGGYVHHFTFRKMKVKEPQELAALISRFILDTGRPVAVPPKKRAPKGSRKRPENLHLSRTHLDRILQMARMSGDKEILSVLGRRKPLPVAKRELIRSIRDGKVEPEMWNSYVDAVKVAEAGPQGSNLMAATAK